MVTVKELINRDFYTIKAGEKVRDLLKLFVEKQVSGVPVVDENGGLVGIITDADILGQIHKPTSLLDTMTYIMIFDTDAIVSGEIDNLIEKPVHELMTRKVITVTLYDSLSDVARIFSKRKFKKVPVVDGQKLIGVVSRGDMVRYLVREFLQKSDVPSNA